MTLCLNHDEKWLVFIGDLVGFPKVRLGLTSFSLNNPTPFEKGRNRW